MALSRMYYENVRTQGVAQGLVDDLLLVGGQVIIPHIFLPPLSPFSRSLSRSTAF